MLRQRLLRDDWFQVSSYRFQVSGKLKDNHRTINMKSYRELEIYKESKRLAIEIHKMTMSLPKFELYEEGSQI
jgi:hypothetical protein